MKSCSFFDDLVIQPPLEYMTLEKRFKMDKSEKKVNLGAGVYLDDGGKPWTLPAATEAERSIAFDDSLCKERQPPLGNIYFCRAVSTLVLGRESSAILEQRAFAVQSISGTGAMRLAAEFLAYYLGYTTVYVSFPSPLNHESILKYGGLEDFRYYRYWSYKKKRIDIEGLLEDLDNAQNKSVVLLQCCAHDPTGYDLSREQWKQIADVMFERRHFPIFDTTTIGLATGDMDEDAWPVRYFASRGFELFCTHSFCKVIGVCSERIGALVIVTKFRGTIPFIKSQFEIIVRSMYESPPFHGAAIVSHILNNLNNLKYWKNCLKPMALRTVYLREELNSALQRLGTPGDWENLRIQRGLHSLLGLTEKQCKLMMERYHIYILKSGCINVCGLSEENIEYVAAAIDDCVRNS